VLTQVETIRKEKILLVRTLRRKRAEQPIIKRVRVGVLRSLKKTPVEKKERDSFGGQGGSLGSDDRLRLKKVRDFRGGGRGGSRNHRSRNAIIGMKKEVQKARTSLTFRRADDLGNEPVPA